ncbi:1532_t:CDS:1, partial [Funneliformis geosporum]
LTDAYQLYVLYYVDGGEGGNNQNFDICTEIKCPVKAGTKFEMKQNALVPGLPPNGYGIDVGIYNKDYSKMDLIACASAHV